MNKLYYLFALFLSIMFFSFLVASLHQSQTLQTKGNQAHVLINSSPDLHTLNNNENTNQTNSSTPVLQASNDRQTVNQAPISEKLSENQTMKQSFQSNETTEPLILNVSTNLFGNEGMLPLDGDDVHVTATVEYADTCILSYIVYSDNYPTVKDWSGPLDTWINVTMSANGITYSGTIPNSLPWMATVHWKITASDLFSHSVETDTRYFNAWNDF